MECSHHFQPIIIEETSNVRLYELANVYLPKQLPLTELPDERMQLTLRNVGDGDFFTMKGVIETLMSKLGLKKKARV